MAAAWGLDPAPGANSIEKTFGAPFDPWLNDETFTTSVLSLEELGATGNKARRVRVRVRVRVRLRFSLPGSITGACRRSQEASFGSFYTRFCLHKRLCLAQP